MRRARRWQVPAGRRRGRSRSNGGWTEIRKGLQAGQKVVVSGQFLIDSEASLKGTVTRMGGVARRTRLQAAASPAREGRSRRRSPGDTMIARLIRWSIANRFLVLLATLCSRRGACGRCRTTPLDAMPDLSDVQVIIRTTLSRAGAADRREPGHLSADDDDAVGARREDGARLFVLRRFVRLRPVRGRHRSRTGRARACSNT